MAMHTSTTAGPATGASGKQAAASYDHLMKLLLIGDSGVGKSCLLQRFSGEAFQAPFITTIGIDFKIRTIEIEGKRLKLQIWDTAGQERFRTITTAYYRSAMGILLVYSITDDRSFQNIKQWLKGIEQHAQLHVNKILVGNKSDSHDKRKVKYEDAEAFAHGNGLEYVETSARDMKNVDKAFTDLATQVKHRVFDNQATAGNSSGGKTNPQAENHFDSSNDSASNSQTSKSSSLSSIRVKQTARKHTSQRIFENGFREVRVKQTARKSTSPFTGGPPSKATARKHSYNSPNKKVCSTARKLTTVTTECVGPDIEYDMADDYEPSIYDDDNEKINKDKFVPNNIRIKQFARKRTNQF